LPLELIIAVLVGSASAQNTGGGFGGKGGGKGQNSSQNAEN
jgi:hypothetical protein